MKNWWGKQEKITVKEVILRYLIIILAGIIALTSDTDTKQWLNVFAFGSGIVGTFYLKKHFFPFMTFCLLFYFAASVNELIDEQYKYTPFTITLWNIGNILLPIAIFTFATQLVFKYKIVNRDD